MLLCVSGIRKTCVTPNLSMCNQLEDLIDLEGLLTEDAVIKVLQARFYAGKYYVRFPFVFEGTFYSYITQWNLT